MKIIFIMILRHDLPFSFSFSLDCTVEISRDLLTCNDVITLLTKRMPACVFLCFLVFSMVDLGVNMYIM